MIEYSDWCMIKKYMYLYIYNDDMTDEHENYMVYNTDHAALY